jgi:hypothetical protein
MKKKIVLVIGLLTIFNISLLISKVIAIEIGGPCTERSWVSNKKPASNGICLNLCSAQGFCIWECIDEGSGCEQISCKTDPCCQTLPPSTQSN